MKKFDSKSMVTQLIVLIFIINTTLLLVFTFLFLKQNQSFNKYQMEKGLEKIAVEKAQVVSLTMKQISNEVLNLSLWAKEYMFAVSDHKLPPYYIRDNRGILGRVTNDNIEEHYLSNLSNIYFPNNIKLSQKVINEIVTTEKLDKVFSEVRSRNPYIQWVYITTEEGLMRILPYSTNDILAPDQDQRITPFYKFATPKENPSRDIVWTKPYIDYMGTGWMVTCSYPIYDKDRFVGVICVDVRLDTLENDILADFRLGKSGFAFLLSYFGDIIYHPDYIPSDGKMGDIFSFNLLSDNLSEDYKAIIRQMIEGEEGVSNYYNNADKKNHLIAYSQIPDLGWALGIEINQEDYLSNNSIYKYNFLIYIFLLTILLMLLAVFLFRQYSKPILQLTKEAQQISEGEFGSTRIMSNFSEIKILSEAFNKMSSRIEIYTKSLVRRTNQIETIFNSIGGLLMIITPDYKIVTMNQKGYDKFSKKFGKTTGLPCYRILAGKMTPCPGCNISEVVKTKRFAHVQLAIEDKIFHNAYYPIINGEEKIEEIIVYSQDITERVIIEKELNQSEKMAGIGKLSSAIAHELKNPLAIIKGVGYVLREYTRKGNIENFERNLQIIDDAVTSAEKVIYNLLNFSSPAQNYFEMVNVSKIIEQILLFERKNIIKQTVELKVKFEPDPIYLYGNADAIKHIFLNIITNALDALSEGGTLSIRGCYTDTSKQDKVKITISDTGCGIPLHIQSKIFNPFFSTKDNNSGTGLGLWISKSAITKLSGEIKVNSTPESGTTFTIILPAGNSGERELNVDEIRHSCTSC